MHSPNLRPNLPQMSRFPLQKKIKVNVLEILQIGQDFFKKFLKFTSNFWVKNTEILI